MGITDKLFDGLKAGIRLSARVEAIGDRIETLAHEIRDLDRRLVRVETTLELATSGKFTPLPLADERSDDDDR